MNKGLNRLALYKPFQQRVLAGGELPLMPVSFNDFECSIIIPQYGKAELTVQCLDSLADYVVFNNKVEVIVVDDASPDDSVLKLQKFKRFPVRIVRNSRNKGFAHSCNHGAALARSPVVVFLNNDTLSMDDWLTPMLTALKADPNRGIIGAQLLNQDGTVQHAGVWFFPSTEGPMTALERSEELRLDNIGPNYRTSHVVPAVTGACMMLRRRDFLEVGGFDETYLNDVEDTDLCLKINQRGQVCWYEATATLVHLHSVTRGVNYERTRKMLGVFYKKWAGNDYMKITLPQPHKPWRRLSQDFIIFGHNNRWEVWQIIQTILLVWQTGDRIILIDNGSSDGTREIMENIARHNSESVVFATADYPWKVEDLDNTGWNLRSLQAIWMPDIDIAPYRWEMSLKNMGLLTESSRIVFDNSGPLQEEWNYQPLISIIMPVYNPNLLFLKKAIESVQAQYYSNWELCICIDGSTDTSLSELLDYYSESDYRVKIRHLESNQGIAAASNAAIELATGEYVGLLDQDDELATDALWWVVEALQEKRWDVLYSNEDKIEPDGRFIEPFFKPDWSPITLYSLNYVSHFGVYRKLVGDKLGWFRPGLDGSQDYDLILRFSAITNEIFHIPRVLYHWRKSPESVAYSPVAKTWAYQAALKALNGSLKARRWNGRVVMSEVFGHYRRLPSNNSQRVSIIITVHGHLADLKRCLTSIRRFTKAGTYDLVFVIDSSVDSVTREYIYSMGHPHVDKGQSFLTEYEAYHLAVETYDNGLVLFLHDDVEVTDREWLDELAQWALTPGIGPVAPKILEPNGRVAEAGLYLDSEKIVAPFYSGFTRDQKGYFGALSFVRNVSAISDTSFMIRRDVFNVIGGFFTDLKAYYLVDFCLSARQAGYHTIVTPWSEVIHYQHHLENDNQISGPDTIAMMKAKWGVVLAHDPYFYPKPDASSLLLPVPVNIGSEIVT